MVVKCKHMLFLSIHTLEPRHLFLSADDQNAVVQITEMQICTEPWFIRTQQKLVNSKRFEQDFLSRQQYMLHLRAFSDGVASTFWFLNKMRVTPDRSMLLSSVSLLEDLHNRLQHSSPTCGWLIEFLGFLESA